MSEDVHMLSNKYANFLKVRGLINLTYNILDPCVYDNDSNKTDCSGNKLARKTELIEYADLLKKTAH